jgi:hypothetical protein
MIFENNNVAAKGWLKVVDRDTGEILLDKTKMSVF